MKKTVGIILLLVALGFGYLGVQQINESKESLEIGNLELSAENEEKSQFGYVYLGLNAMCLIGGVVLFNSKSG